MVFVWFIIFLILLVIELMNTDLKTIWFVVGALAAMITTIFTNLLLIQIVVFIIVSVITLVVTRPIISKIKDSKKVIINSKSINKKKKK
ncbi:MAG: hypothetical protein IJI58_03790 [Bacilli bacterium]|nr:hypothetical protein [Bacilli bacterium]